MASKKAQIEVYLEVGRKKVFAGALDWPGWCRSAGDEGAALATLVAYAPRYATIVSGTTIDLVSPDDPAAYAVVERLAGTSATDFGAPDRAPARDEEPFEEAARERSEAILAAIWRAFDRAVRAAEGKELRKGPRGGGRDRDGIVRHVLGADAAYLRRVAQKFSQDEGAPLDDQLQRTREAIRTALAAGGARGDPARGAARRRALDAALLRAARRLAHRRSPLGDRGSDRVSGAGPGLSCVTATLPITPVTGPNTLRTSTMLRSNAKTVNVDAIAAPKYRIDTAVAGRLAGVPTAVAG